MNTNVFGAMMIHNTATLRDVQQCPCSSSLWTAQVSSSLEYLGIGRGQEIGTRFPCYRRSDRSSVNSSAP